eukprot:TRINITY_DN63798_c0_g1_i1.p1 TRINITY_DN63798_c0_g1~~TRINITY_DN63798_c0_g1_i1.p1  ORF type:complete len:699 (-),score=99.24 TRINITY_DN63798_c0_g1_i1:22-2118(-)
MQQDASAPGTQGSMSDFSFTPSTRRPESSSEAKNSDVQTRTLFREAVQAMSDLNFHVDERMIDTCRSAFHALEKAVNRAQWATQRCLRDNCEAISGFERGTDDVVTMALDGISWEPKQLLMFLFDFQQEKKPYQRRALCTAQTLIQISELIRDAARSDAFLRTWLGACRGPSEPAITLSFEFADSLRWATWDAGWYWVNTHRRCDATQDKKGWEIHREKILHSMELPSPALQLILCAVWAAAEHAASTRAQEGLMQGMSKMLRRVSPEEDPARSQGEFYKAFDDLKRHGSVTQDLAADLMWMIWNIAWFTANEGRGYRAEALKSLVRAERHLQRTFRGDIQWRGVNLGGWFLLEPGPCDFFYKQVLPDVARQTLCEWSCCDALEPEMAKRLLAEHRKTYFCKEDFLQMRKAGLSHVRLPFGYWCIAPRANEPYVGQCLEALDRAIDMIESAGLFVLLDLHGTVGGESAEAPCGHRDSNWKPQDWNPTASLEILRIVAERYAGRKSICGIGVANEPSEALDVQVLAGYFEAAVDVIRQAGMRAGQVAIFLPIFTERRIGEFMHRWKEAYPKYADCVFDVHFYQCFGPYWTALSEDAHLQQARARKDALQSLPCCCVSEWSLALPEGLERSLSQRSACYLQECQRRFGEAQLEAYETATHGWFFWTWRDSAGLPWNMKRCLADGVLKVPSGPRSTSLENP